VAGRGKGSGGASAGLGRLKSKGVLHLEQILELADCRELQDAQ
jgi:hypothetical protein